MGEVTGIQWCHSTINFWRGCSRVSEGCRLCYAEAMSRRNPAVLGTWGPDGTRPIASESKWREMSRWNEDAANAGERRRVFCGSLMDIWEDRPDLVGPRIRGLSMASCTKSLDWLFLSKRPENIKPILSDGRIRYGKETLSWWERISRKPMSNWWFGCTVENQRRARERIPILLEVPASIRFLSCEPLLEPLDLSPWLSTGGIHWVIVGGESNQGGGKAASLCLSWVEELVGQCKDHNVPVFVKQLGSRPVAEGLGLKLKDRHGGEMAEWPPWLRVREIPA